MPRTEVADILSSHRLSRSWNPVTGCTKVSAGCLHCYAERFARRLQRIGNPRYRDGFKVTIHPDKLALPIRWRSPSLVFVNSMSDLFHKDIPDGFIKKVFDVMVKAYWHRFQVLTKRSERLRRMASELPWAPNIWMGVTVELADYYYRVDDLRTVPAAVRFLSCEPLLGPLSDLPLEGIDWVWVGGESGPRARPMRLEWVLAIKEQCEESNVAFFLKEWGGLRRCRSGGRLLERKFDGMPTQRTLF